MHAESHCRRAQAFHAREIYAMSCVYPGEIEVLQVDCSLRTGNLKQSNSFLNNSGSARMEVSIIYHLIGRGGGLPSRPNEHDCCVGVCANYHKKHCSLGPESKGATRLEARGQQVAEASGDFCVTAHRLGVRLDQWSTLRGMLHSHVPTFSTCCTRPTAV